MMMTRILQCFALLFTLTNSVRSDIFPGRCPSYEGHPDFDTKKFMGTWYEVERYFPGIDLKSRCITLVYNQLNDSTLELDVQQILFETPLNTSFLISQDQPNEKAKMIVHIMGLNDTNIIIGTDYESYAVIWRCKNYSTTPESYGKSLRILTRQQLPSPDVLEEARKVIDNHNIVRTKFSKINHKNCLVEESPYDSL